MSGGILLQSPGLPAGLRPLYVAGRYYRADGGLTTQALTLNRLYYVPIYFHQSVTVDSLSVDCTATSASSVVRMGLYNADLSTYKPSSLIIETSTVDTASSTGQKEVDITNTALGPGLYFTACVGQGGTPTLRAGGFTVGSMAGWAGNTATSASLYSFVEDSVSSSLPASATVGNQSHTGGMPLVFLKLA